MNEKYFIEKSKDDYEILRINNDDKKIYIGSKYNEEREIKKIIESVKPMTDNDNYIVLGLGIGNHIRELIKEKSKQAQILVVECEEDWICEFEKNNNIKTFNEKVYVTKKEDDIKNFFDLYINEQNVDSLKIVSYANYNKLYTKEIFDYYKKIKEYINGRKINKNTRLLFSKVWFESKIKNLQYLSRSETLNEYKDRHKNKPAIIVSAGPSLSKNIDVLKKYNNAVIISGGRTLKSLINIGKEPQYSVIIDPSDKSYELVDGYIDKVNSKLVYELGTPHKALNQHTGGKIVFADEIVVGEIMDKPVGTLYGGGSVAHYMTTLAIHLGCNPIIFIGQDFAYTDEKGHAEIAESPWATIEVESCKAKGDLLVEDINGGYVRTSAILNMYRKQMEKIIEGRRDVTFVNATEGGANMKGTEVKRLEDVLSEYSEDIRDEKNNEIFNESIQNNLIDRLQESYISMKKVHKLYNKGIQILKKYNNLVKFGVVDTAKIEIKLEEIEERIMELNEKIILIENVVYPIINNITNSEQLIYKVGDTEREKRLKNIKKSIVIYEEMKNVINYAQPIVEDVIEELIIKEI